MKTNKILYLGNGNYGCDVLDLIINSKLNNFDLKWCVTTNDKFVRKNLKKYEKLTTCVHLSTSKKETEKIAIEYKPNIILCASFGQIITKTTINSSKLGAYNFHPSLLPKYRGASPIRSALLNDEKATGLTLFRMSEKMDAGDVYLQERILINRENHYPDVYNNVLIKTKKMIGTLINQFDELENIKLLKQINEKATYCNKITDSDGFLDFNRSASHNLRIIKALGEFPGAFIKFGDKHLIIRKAHLHLDKELLHNPCDIFIDQKQLFARTKDALIIIDELQLEGKKRMDGKSFINGWKGNRIIKTRSYQ